jgi:hypothetical protein
MWAVGVVMVVPPFVVVLAHAAWWSRGGGIDMDVVSDGVFEKVGECTRNKGGGRGLEGASVGAVVRAAT